MTSVVLGVMSVTWTAVIAVVAVVAVVVVAQKVLPLSGHHDPRCPLVGPPSHTNHRSPANDVKKETPYDCS
jgi:hypothetical protein